MKVIFNYFFVLLGFYLFIPEIVAQEGLSPLTVNSDLTKNAPVEKLNVGTFDSTFIYTSDTLSLPFFDEFSKNHFQRYDFPFTGPGITSDKKFVLTDTDDVPFSASRKFSTNQTYRRTFNVAEGNFEDENFPAEDIKVGDLTAYPPVYTTTSVYPPYIIYDTLDFANPSDTIWLFENLAVQDSATQFFAQLNDKNAYWLDDYAYHNYRFAENPWTLGVVTFDGLNQYGYPYALGSSSTGIADYLTSKPIDMSGQTAADSVYFSFLYQKEGFGDIPEESDSLILEFYAPQQDQWFRVWSANGGASSDFNKVHFVVKDAKYFEETFQFRFKNYGGLSGSLDHFHIDYVHLRPLSGYQDTLFKDFAFVYPIGSLLKDYTAVPWDHYVNNPDDKMSDEVKIVVRNGSNVPENSQNGTVQVSYAGTPEGSFTLSNVLLTNNDPSQNYGPRTTFESFHDFSTGYRFDETKGGTKQEFEITSRVSAQFPNLPQNDSSAYVQAFNNYYSYDDGSAEQAYGIIGAQARLAYQFTPYESDSLIGVMMHFVPSVVDVSNKLFLLTVWADDNGKPGEILYEDDFFYAREPEYATTQNGFVTYFLKDTMKLKIDGTFYVGWRQLDVERLNIGFDRNTVHNEKIFYSLNNGFSWENSTFQGCMMMRPLFSTGLDAELSIPQTQKENYVFEVYPNPTENQVNLRVDELLFSGAILTDIQGKTLIQVAKDERQLDFSSYPSGIYFLKDLTSGAVQKIVKK